MKKLYIIKKFILAEDIHEALKLEPESEIQECYIEENSAKKLLDSMTTEEFVGLNQPKK